MRRDAGPEADIFEMLGIGAREDSYTDLISHACRADSDMRRRVVEFVGLPVREDWRVHTRRAAEFSDEGARRRRAIPDLVVSSDAGIALVEIKLHADEGKDQLRTYALEEVAQRLGEILECSPVVLRKVYLTLHEAIEAPPGWDHRSLREFALDVVRPWVESADASNMALVLGEMVERISQAAGSAAPHGDDEVIAYLEQPWSWGNALATEEPRWCALAETISPVEFDVPHLKRVDNRWGNPNWIVGWERPHWRFDDGDLPCCVHFELHWYFLEGRLALYLHFEPDPWAGERDLNQPFKNRRARFRDDLASLAATETGCGFAWQVAGGNSGYTIAKVELPSTITVAQLRRAVADLTLVASPIVDVAIGA